MLTHDQIITLSDTLHLMGEANRLKLLITCLQGPKSVSELAEHLQLSLPLTSHHLSLLRSARLLVARREGKHIYYSIFDTHVRCILEDMLKHFTEEMGN
ncbi:ArsR/SmtB family transcription factor [Legionella longbeachae]|uniref:Putative transcriptional regulator, ArsR family n=1 Tax=Legionella longbeachae serogroup 1 (strain NSW150) TaxID=661367 RepID=D3HS97_LEGLN|nr:metalloregulator ArsR/SmtB family transcription factor [Legionella longbeachae]VEE02280.1 transcriptional regulator, ArsR family [Legionella oakridgensis]HBD7398230.1 helix-turn-helix transcriptional regulator [Legionella pneumophila]ARB91427.1 transcriptional regulator [Legionella longbeachae]EEZ95081.1 ArsR family transcriptional regulator [Legionella longbeachae D-4968]QIN32149.1 metalloregulator ArsR/SmtB family transcription factor [Legionella longbeachae]